MKSLAYTAFEHLEEGTKAKKLLLGMLVLPPVSKFNRATIPRIFLSRAGYVAPGDSCLFMHTERGEIILQP